VTGDETRLLDEIRGANRPGAESQVTHCNAARFFRVVEEIALAVMGRAFADDLDRILVGADGAIRPEAEEHRPYRVPFFQFEGVVVGQRQAGDIVIDADGKMLARLLAGQFVEDGLDHGRGELLGGQAVAAAYHLERQGSQPAGFAERGDDIHVERFADRAGFLGPVEHGDGHDRHRQDVGKAQGRERPVEPDLDHADFVAAGIHFRNRLLDGFGAGPHDHDHPFGIRIAGKFEQIVVPAGYAVELLHGLADYIRTVVIKRVDGFAPLEVDVRILGRSPYYRPIRIESPVLMGANLVIIDQPAKLRDSEFLDLVDLV